MLVYRKPCAGPEPATFNIYTGNTSHSPSELFSDRLHQVLRLVRVNYREGGLYVIYSPEDALRPRAVYHIQPNFEVIN
jgi:hypothetical protein